MPPRATIRVLVAVTAVASLAAWPAGAQHRVNSGLFAPLGETPPIPKPFHPGLLFAQLESPVDDATATDASATVEEDEEESADEAPAGPRVLPTVVSVTFSGNRRIEAAALKGVVRLKTGQPYDPERVRADIRALWAQKLFEDVKVDAVEVPGGLGITYLLTEKPLVREVRITGVEELDADDLKKELEVKPFQIVDPDTVRKTLKKLQEKYADKGYFLAEVTHKVVPAPGENLVDVVFEVVEHAKVEVKRVSFTGNKALSDDELKAVMGTQEASLLSLMTPLGTFKQETFQRDQLVIQSMYYNKGYINVRVNAPAISLSPDKRSITITIPIEEGEPYDYGKVGLAGNLLGQDAEVAKLLTIKEGMRFSSQDLQKSMSALQDYFRDQGYAYVTITPQTGVDVPNKKVALDFLVTPGPLVTVERIDIVGNTKTRDRVVRRELRIGEGETYNGNLIRLSKSRVTALGFFETVDITSRAGNRPDTMVLEVSVKERATGTFQLGFGFSQQEPILLNGNVSQNNFLGWGTNGAFMIQWSRLRQIFSLSYTDPWFLDTPWTLAFDLFNTLQTYSSFDRLARGGTLTLGRQLDAIDQDLRVFGTYTLQWIEVQRTSTDVVIVDNQFRNGLTSSIKGSFNWDKRDNRLFPTSGFLLSGSVEHAPKWLFSTNEFTRWSAILRGYVPLPFGIVAKANLTLGYIDSPANNRVPISELYYEGGIYSLRGYNFRSVSPTLAAGVQPGDGLSPLAVGGNKELIGNVELEFPILAEAQLRGVLFYDVGNVWGFNQNFFSDTGSTVGGLLHAVGFGVRWFTPLGPLRFELGIPLTPRPTDQSSRFEFTIGNFF